MADADIVTHAPVTSEWLTGLLPDDCYIGWLDRLGVYPECGFYIINANDPAHAMVMADLWALYETGEILHFAQTHDCIALQNVISRYRQAGVIKVHSLSGEWRKSSHPLVNSKLGECLDHLKGARKGFGKSPTKGSHAQANRTVLAILMVLNAC